MDEEFEREFLRKKQAYFIRKATELAERLDWFFQELPYRGDKCSDSQKVCLMLALKNLKSVINGTELEDFKQEDE